MCNLVSRRCLIRVSRSSRSIGKWTSVGITNWFHGDIASGESQRTRNSQSRRSVCCGDGRVDVKETVSIECKDVMPAPGERSEPV